MELFGLLEANLTEKEISPSDELVNLINTVISPPKPVAKDNIYIRIMFLASDQINSYGGRFPQDELAKITELVIDSPVIVGHKKEKLPIARNFKAELVEKDGIKWVKVWFYWLKSSEGALSLKENIDHGIYKECSLSFVFEYPECSICGEDMRKCPHIPFKSYPPKDNQPPCTSTMHGTAYFNYRGINKVLETSLVYRGAVPNTSISDELAFYKKEKVTPLEFVDFNFPFVSETSSNIFFHLEDLSSLFGKFLVEPLYDGIRVQIHKSDEEVKICDKDKNEISQKFPSLSNLLRSLDKNFILDGQIVRYKGKSRVPRNELFDYLSNNSKDDFGFRFKLFDILYLNCDLSSLPLERRKKIIEENFEDSQFFQKVKYQIASPENLIPTVKKVSSSEGATIKDINSVYHSPQSWLVYRKNLEIDCLVTKIEKNKGGSYNYLCAIENQDGLLEIGTTYSTHLKAKEGDVICVSPDLVEKNKDRFRWIAPKVVEIKKDENHSDKVSTLERMCNSHSKCDVEISPKKGFRLVGLDGLGYVLVIEKGWVKRPIPTQESGKVVGFKFGSFDIEKLGQNRKFLVKRLEDISNYDFVKVEQNIEILDEGNVNFTENEDRVGRLVLDGKLLKGNCRIVPIKFKGNRNYIFFKEKQKCQIIT